MRSYSRNSPEAAARIVALVLIADGTVCHAEFHALSQLDAPHELGLAPEAMPGLVQSLCEDLLMGAHSGGFMRSGVDECALVSLMAEVDDPLLQRTVLRLAVATARADRHLAHGEAVVLAAAHRLWGLQGNAAPGDLPIPLPLPAIGAAQVRAPAMICSTSG